MNRLAVRLVASHALVAVLGAAATYLIVRQLAPSLFDQNIMHAGMGQMMGRGGNGATAELRTQFADAVDQALLVGSLVGAAAAALFGSLAAFALVRPLGRVRAATRAMAGGRYDQQVPVPRERELADLVTDVNALGAALATTEARRVRLIGEVAHEMRTPLTVIDGYVEAMIDGVMPTSPAQLERGERGGTPAAAAQREPERVVACRGGARRAGPPSSRPGDPGACRGRAATPPGRGRGGRAHGPADGGDPGRGRSRPAHPGGHQPGRQRDPGDAAGRSGRGCLPHRAPRRPYSASPTPARAWPPRTSSASSSASTGCRVVAAPSTTPARASG